MDTLAETFFERMPMGVALIDRALRLQRHNPTWAELTAGYAGVPLERVQPGKGFYELLPGTTQIFAPRFARAFAGETIREEGLQLRHGDADIYLDLVLTPQRANGRITHVLLVANDVSARMLAQRLAERRVADRTRRLVALYEVMEVAGEPLDLSTMLTRLLERVLQAVRSHAGVIYLLTETGEALQLVAQLGLDAALTQPVEMPLSDSGLPGEVIRLQEPVVVGNVRSDARARPAIRRTSLHAYVGVPMFARGRLLGVLSVFRESKRPFLNEDVAMLDSIADQIGVAVENSRLRQKAEQLAIIEERSRLSRELHDAITQSLYSISLMATASRRLAQADEHDPLLHETLADLSATAQQALKEMRLLLYRLRPLALQDHDLVEALRQRLAAVEKRAGVEAHLLVDDVVELPPAVEESLYFIAQEALNNALKHAAATAVRVAIHPSSEEVLLTVSDNGCGFDPAAAATRGGLGLTTMRERAEALQGTLTIDTRPSAGTTITVCLPLVGETTTTPAGAENE